MIMKRKSVIAIAAALTLCASAAGVFGMGAGCVAEAARSLNIDIHPPKVDVKGPLVAASLTVDGKETDYNDAGTAFSEMWGKHGAVMKLYKDWDIHDRMWVDSRCDGNTLDLNGHVITRHADYQRADGEIMNISGGAHFTMLLYTVHVQWEKGIKTLFIYKEDWICSEKGSEPLSRALWLLW